MKEIYSVASETVSTQKSAKTTRPKSILEAVEHIVTLAKESKFEEKFFTEALPYTRYISRKLKLSVMQSVLLSIFIDQSDDEHIRLSDIGRFVDCSTIRLLRLADDIEVLERLRYIRASYGGRISYHVPAKVLKALRKNQPYVHEEMPVTDTKSFFDCFNALKNEKEKDELTYDSLKTQTSELLNKIKSTPFALSLSKLQLDEYDSLLFIFMANRFVQAFDDCIMFSDIESLYDDNEIPGWCKHELSSRESALFKKNLIENNNEDGIARPDAFKLTDWAKEELLGELRLSVGNSDYGLMKYDTITEKKLIYNPVEDSQITELSSLLMPDRFRDIQAQFHKAGMRPGFCCLFYGTPGTGKTETVYQLARQTGRNIMQIDVDKIKSCWVGESEKNIKLFFNRYRNICKNSEIAPILLFNEADAVLGVRMEGAVRAVDKMENSIQNIILQQMESLEGIMIATTNLTDNLDKAFERRFLYKVKYEKPSVEARAAIWQIMLPGLTDEDASKLASRFDLSGGEIENIARKHTVKTILSGKSDIDINTLTELCRNERITSLSRAKVGF